MASSPAPRPSLAANPPPLPLLRSQLRQAVSLNSSRQLSHSAKLAAELLAALPPPYVDERRKGRPLAAASSGATVVHPHNGAAGGAGGEQHVHFKTSTPVRGGPTASTSRGAGGVGGGRDSLGGLPPIHPGVAQLAATGGGGKRPRDSLGSVLSIDPASSPAQGHGRSTISMAEEDEDEEGVDETGDLSSYLPPPHPHASSSAARDPREEWAERDEDEQDLVALAETYFRAHELLRASWVLRDCKGAKARWLRCYSKYLAGEKRLADSLGELLGPSDKTSARGSGNPYTQELLDEMASWEMEDRGFVEADGGLMYLKALLFLSLPPIAPTPSHSHTQPFSHPSNPSAPPLDLRLAALETLVKSVNLEPWNWSAWLKIAECLDGPEELEATLPFLPATYPLLFFYIHATLEIHAANDVLHDVLDELEGVFPGRNGEGCSVVTGMRALVHYHVREFDESTSLFLSLQRTDPYRIDDVDILSNILYVSEKRAELASLAQEYTRVERARPEVCCLVGNYFSLRRDHEKAILYFRRALKLDRGYLSAWTLMGHEYVEIKNTNAAIASYRRAVDVNRKDYRAWYGLGQTYELLGEPFYALDYYQRATALRPYDARMWSALASCYEKLKRIPDAIRSHQRALLASEPGDGTDLCLRIGKLLSSLGQTDHAAAYHRRALLEGQRGGWGVSELGRVWGWLVRYEIARERGRLGRARARREEEADSGDEDKEDEDEEEVKEDVGEGGDLERAEEYLRAMEGSQEFRDEAKALRKEVEVLMLERE